ncbi:hypothetical protein [Streptomyces sp. NPDC002855]|uniref:hypothetical protein n=1 Tax=Streptomyces sp. NPDC002855 TaxID=3154437 RepID=UPI003320FA13
MTAVDNATFTAAQFNTHVRDNLLETGPAKITAANQYLVATGSKTMAARTPAVDFIATAESTTSTSYTNLTTTGPAVTVTTGTAALVDVGANMRSSLLAEGMYMGVTVSGATTLAAADALSLGFDGTPSASCQVLASKALIYTGLTAGSNTFTAKYRSTAAGNTALYVNRRIIVIPL